MVSDLARSCRVIAEYILFMGLGLTVVTVIMLAEASFLVLPSVFVGWWIIGFLMPIWCSDDN